MIYITELSFLRVGPRWFSLCTVLLAVAALFVFPERANAQEFRGTISGTVTDPTGAVVRDAPVIITETSTGTINRTRTDNAGQYVVPFLQPGVYQIVVETTGFKKEARNGVTLQANEHPLIDMVLQVGSALETVSVTADAPLIDTANASVGETITTKEVEDLPVDGRTPITLSELAVGVVPTSQPSQIHPFDNSGASSWSIGGTPAQASEVLLDGSPDTTWQGDVAYNPPQGAVKELSVSVSDTDASFGHTIGGVMNQITMSGTNKLHGSLYEFHVIPGLAADTYFNKHNGTIIQLPDQKFNQYGVTVGGPVFIPKVFDGRNKVFFFFAFEALPDSTPSTTTNTVPTDAERTGDFSALLPLGCPSGYLGSDSSHCANGKPNTYQFYNPFTATLVGSTVTRTPIPNNILTNAGPLNPIALAYLKFYPEPNVANPNVDGTNNYISNAPAVDTFNSEFSRVDWNMSDKSHIFGDFHRNYRTNHKQDIFENGASGQSSQRPNLGATLDEVYTLNDTTVMDVRANWNYYSEITVAAGPTFNPGTVGFPSYMTTSSLTPELPAISPGYTSLGFAAANKNPTTIYQLFGDVAKTIGRDTLKFGVDTRQYRVDVANTQAASGTFSFGSNFVQSSSSGTAPVSDAGDASFLLGLPTSGSYVQAAIANFHANYIAFFVQNDWRVTSHFTVNIGLRYDHQSPFEDKLSRVVNGFNPTAVNSASAAASAAYAAHPISQIPPASFNTLGGLTFPNTPKNGAQYQTVSHWVSPRLGFSYSPGFLKKGTVVRGGFSMFVLPANLDTLSTLDVPGSSVILNQEGYTASTSYVATNNAYLTPANTLSNPFPNGFTPAAGSSLGASTFLGQGLTFYAPTLTDPYALRWNVGIQHALTPNLLLEVDYIGDHAVHQPIASTALDYIPQRFLSTMPIRDTTLVNAYAVTVNNPYAGLLPGSTNSNGSTITLSSLLMTYPEFSGVTEENNTEGSSVFHSVDFRVEKRMSHGISVTANYSFSKLIEAMQYLNAGDTKLDRILSPYDHKQHLAIGSTYELPIGSGKLIDIKSGVWNSIIGGFKINGIYTFQTGAPLFFSADLPTTGVPITSATRVTTPAKALNVAAFDQAPGDQFSFHLRVLPLTFGNVRTDGINQLDASLLKDFHFREGMYAQFRFETFNALNHASFAAPAVSSATSSSFGTITSQANSARTVQLGGRFVF